MFKKSILFFVVAILLVNLSNPVEAGLFKKNKSTAEKKQTQEQGKKHEEKKVLVAEIFASWCPGCKNIQPTIDQLVKDVTDIEFVQLDVSTPSKAKVAAKQAQDLHITEFYRASKSKTATVAVIVPTSGEVVNIFQNNNDIEEYKSAIEEAKTKEKSLHNPPE